MEKGIVAVVGADMAKKDALLELEVYLIDASKVNYFRQMAFV